MAFEFAGIVLLLVAAVNAGLIIPTVEVLQGPGSKTTLVGPDGSALSAIAPGGTVVTNDGGIGLVAAAPAVLGSSPQVVVAGPSGTIATINTLAGPAIVPGVITGAPATIVSAPGAIIAAPAGAADASSGADGDDGSAAENDNSGAYVPDDTEKQFDDGSYKEEK